MFIYTLIMTSLFKLFLNFNLLILNIFNKISCIVEYSQVSSLEMFPQSYLEALQFHCDYFLFDSEIERKYFLEN